MSDIKLFRHQGKSLYKLNVEDFKLLFSLGVFNNKLMHTSVCKFKYYEYAILEYTGIFTHKGEEVGLYDTVLSRKGYKENFVYESV